MFYMLCIVLAVIYFTLELREQMDQIEAKINNEFKKVYYYMHSILPLLLSGLFVFFRHLKSWT